MLSAARAVTEPYVPLEAADERGGKEAVRADDDVIGRGSAPAPRGGVQAG